MASAQAWSIKKWWASKYEEFLRPSSAGWYGWFKYGWLSVILKIYSNWDP